MEQPPSGLKHIGILGVGILSVSFAAIFIRFCHDVPAISIAAWRMTLASLVLIAIAVIRRTSLKDVGRKEWMAAALGAVFLALHFVTWISSLKMTSIASSVALVTTNPIFVGIFAWLILKEKQQKELLIGILLSVAGSVILAAGDGGLSGFTITNQRALMGDLLALAGAVMGSGYLITGSIIREKVDIFRHILMVYPLAAVVLLIIAGAGGFPMTGFEPLSYGNLVALALISQLLGHTAFNWALKHLKTSMVAITLLCEPIGAAILAWLFFREGIGGMQLTGMILIFSAVMIAARRGRKARPGDVLGG